MLLVLALAVRTFLVCTADVITPDGMLYIKLAKLLKNSEWKAVNDIGFYSLYPFTIIPFQKIFADWETAGRMASVFFGSLAVLPLFVLFRKMFDLKIAAVACLFYILSPRIAQYSSDVLREPLYWLLSLSALWAGWKGMSERRWFFVFLSSLFTGLACFTRMEGIGIVLVLCLWSGWLILYRERNVKRLFVFLVVFFVSFPVVFSAPLYFVKSKTGKWEMGHVVSKIPGMIGKESVVVDWGNEKATSQFDSAGLGKVIRNRYVFFIWEAFYKFFRSFHVVFIFLLLFGIVRRKVIPYSKDEIPILIWLSVFFIIALAYAFKISYVSTRHGLLMGIPALLWISMGFFELSARIETFLSARSRAARYGRYTMACLLAIICLAVLPKTLSSSSSDKVEMKKAGIYLKKAGYSGQVFAVQSRINRLTFYTEARFVDIPPIDYGALTEFLRKNGATYLIVDEQTVDEVIKGFREHAGLLGLEKVDVPEFQKYRGYSFALYRVRE